MAKVKKEVTDEKTVKEVKGENLKAPEKLTYEQLEQLTSQYYGKSKALEAELKKTQEKLLEATTELEMFHRNEYWMRIDLLWRIINLEGNEEVFGEGFVSAVCNEFKNRIYPPEVKNPDKKE